jgi:hypothetical protein
MKTTKILTLMVFLKAARMRKSVSVRPDSSSVSLKALSKSDSSESTSPK